jgi:hypothetical protein
MEEPSLELEMGHERGFEAANATDNIGSSPTQSKDVGRGEC